MFCEIKVYFVDEIPELTYFVDVQCSAKLFTVLAHFFLTVNFHIYAKKLFFFVEFSSTLYLPLELEHFGASI